MTPPNEGSAFDLSLLAHTDARPGAETCSPEDQVMLLFYQLRDPLFRYTLSLGVAASDGEDLIQDAFVSLFRHLRLGKSRANLRGWLFRVAHNLALKRKGAALRLHYVGNVSFEMKADQGENPEEHLARAQRHQLLLAVWDALPELDRNCLRLRAEGLRYREIAQALGISLGAVSKSLVRSFEKLSRADARR